MKAETNIPDTSEFKWKHKYFATKLEHFGTFQIFSMHRMTLLSVFVYSLILCFVVSIADSLQLCCLAHYFRSLSLFGLFFPIFFALNSRKICALSELNFITRRKIYVKKNICLWFFASFLVPFLVNDAIFHWINGVDLIRLPFRMQSTNFLPMAFKCMVHLQWWISNGDSPYRTLSASLLTPHSSTLDCCILFYNQLLLLIRWWWFGIKHLNNCPKMCSCSLMLLIRLNVNFALTKI